MRAVHGRFLDAACFRLAENVYFRGARKEGPDYDRRLLAPENLMYAENGIRIMMLCVDDFVDIFQ